MKSGNEIPSLVVDYGQRVIVAIRVTGAVSYGMSMVLMLYNWYGVTTVTQGLRQVTRVDGDAWLARGVTRLTMKTGIPLCYSYDAFIVDVDAVGGEVVNVGKVMGIGR
ncbi:hypothetical protein L1987_46954 [Smallanthus sonchifolius]|uniref:Uncharacterized protein n=1 Tax=Smallanthus sonchifolius TaxID=185202 RepID=A0ACB9G0K6_9ASTR|nr:hypothetical protein L1987_46954 [Smallanthus sonchifolius]